MNNLKYTLTQNWNAFRVIRLVLGIMIAVQAYQAASYAMALVGVVFGLLALLNLGCVGGACAAPTNYSMKKTDTSAKKRTENVSYEEVGL